MTVAPAPALRTGAHVLVQALEAHGVEVIFGLPGIHALPLWDALVPSPIRRIVVRHEQAAGFGAVGYARTGDRPGVYLTSTGPGAFNSLAALSEADASSAPVLHLTSQIPGDLVGANRGYLHESRGQSQAFAAVSRFHVRPATPAALAEAVDEAFRRMAVDPGPATIEIATDVMAAAAPEGAVRVTRVSPPAPDPAAIARVKALVDAAEAPIIWAGGGARSAAADVRALAEALDAPVLTTYNGKGALPSGHPLHAGSSVEEEAMRRLVERADLCIALGTRFSQETTAAWTLAVPPALVQVDLDAGRFGRTYAPAEGVVADVGLFCRALLAAGPTPGSRDGEAAVRAALQARDVEVAGHAAPDEVELMHVLGAALPDDAIVIADMTVAAYWAALYLDAKGPGAFVYPSSGALGCGVPLALGTAAAHPDRPTVAIVGDGGFLMGGHEVLTAAAEGLAFVTLVINDSAYGILRNYQETTFGRTVGVELNAPDFAGLAAAYGVTYIRADGIPGLGAALADALADRSAPVLVELQAALKAPGQSV
ncbi:MAG TPA: thiamine pyrophosphate-binding protein [Gaiellales bacterium]|jgi:acetolactate synthase-1/2/3 large subunit|nr:thiamine pyrophosphate-binding protein [Gaiellales bacterium]